MGNILDQIVSDKRREVAEAKQRTPIEALKEQAASMDPPRNFFAAVTQDSPHINVIAEVKKASPSAGLIREDFDPVKIAQGYGTNGAVAISCLTDSKYFQGDLAYLKMIKEHVTLPVLRKDFMIDPYQLYEARAAGADAILLIAECLSEGEFVDMLNLATELKLTSLVEVHETDSLLRVQPHIQISHADYTLLGINNRNLKEMKTDLNHTLRMLDLVENTKILVSESGIRTHDDVERLRRAGVRSVLVGEHLMKQPDPGKALEALIYGDALNGDDR